MTCLANFSKPGESLMFNKSVSALLLLLSLSLFLTNSCLSEPEHELKQSTRCSICGMFVAKYPAWVAEIVNKDGKIEFFDGVKDMMVYTFHPDQYGGSKKDSISEIWVKDYYSLTFIDAKKAFFVTGSDVYGPMGHEFIPFASMEAAESFSRDHQGKSIITFDKITEKMVESMREGQRMK